MKNNHQIRQNGGKPFIIPIFVMNSGCKHRCIFCNQKITAGNFPQVINRAYFENEVESYLSWHKDRSRWTEIAFYGGSFTNIEAAYQESLLSFAQKYLQAGLVQAIRISTRPDCLSTNILSLLKEYGVQTVEIGAQSFVDEVLKAAQRGHNARTIEEAIRLLKSAGFQTGLHLMAGLPKDTQDGFIYSLNKTIELRPDLVRIHPVLVFRGTELAEEYRQGNYRPLPLAEAVSLCRLAREKLSAAKIRVIRTGLQITKEMAEEGAVLAGPVHPAFGQLVLSALFYEGTKKLLENLSGEAQELKFCIAERDASNFRGIDNSNIKAIKELYQRALIKVKTVPEQKRGSISATVDQGLSLTMEISGID